jgi:ribonuclease HII
LEGGEEVGGLVLEGRLRSQGFSLIAGVDEAGRGPLAGPVVAAAVILNETLDYPGVDDSKKIPADRRERLFWMIVRKARAVGVGMVDEAEIDRTDILRASLKALAMAVEHLDPAPDFLLIDGNATLPLAAPQKAVPQGDSRSTSIGAASIIAKVLRDRIMEAYDRRHPGYGFAVHKGYGTAAHLDAIRRLGPCAIHRMSFAPLRRGDGRS